EGREKTGVGKATLPISEQVEPVYTYLHTAYDRAVIGGNVYYGRQFPELVGSYIFADNYSSKLYTLPNDSIKVDQVSQIAKADQFAQRGVSSVNILANGDVLVTTLGRSAAPTGEVLRLIKSDILNIPVTQEVERSEPLVIGKTEALKSFVTNCARCHGAKGKADGPDSEMLGVKIADFSQSSFQQRRSDEELAKIIRDGGSASNLSPMMPPWGVVLEKEEIDALIQTIRDFEEKQ
ncbi:MAG: cytochrome c, partial [Alphaproteobacteria bacterium]|nr:cytochrome c [Alphaproteobacteria bacterium]